MHRTPKSTPHHHVPVGDHLRARFYIAQHANIAVEPYRLSGPQAAAQEKAHARLGHRMFGVKGSSISSSTAASIAQAGGGIARRERRQPRGHSESLSDHTS